MFEPPQSKASDQYRTVVDPPPPPPIRKRLARPLKITVAAGLLAAALYAITMGQATVSSDNAVLTAYTVSIRAPVAGTFTGEGLTVGDSVPAGGVLGRLHDDRVDDQHVADLSGQFERSNAERRAAVEQRTRLLALRTDLLERMATFQSVEAQDRAQGTAEASHVLRGLAIRNGRLRGDLERKRRLARDGLAPSAELEALSAQVDISDAEVAAQAAILARARIRQGASSEGVMLSDGSNDATYSRQRLDDVALRLSEVDRTIASAAAAEAEARTRLATERQRVARLRDAVLTAPSSGTIWRIGASEGERLGIGDMAVELVDCDATFILAAIPQKRFGDVEIGGVARYRLSGETADRQGTVLGVMGEPDPARDRNLAAMPAPGRGATVLARVSIPAREGPCAVGRTVRVLLRADPEAGFVARLLHWVHG